MNYEKPPATSNYWSPPDLSQTAFVAHNATVIGQVSLGTGSSIWYTAVVRADIEKIAIGAYTNIQDGAILHGDPGILTVLEDSSKLIKCKKIVSNPSKLMHFSGVMR